jgi:hypothetical protein
MVAGMTIKRKGSTVLAEHGFPFPRSKDRKAIAEQADPRDPRAQPVLRDRPDQLGLRERLDQLDLKDLPAFVNAAPLLQT